LKYVSKSQEAIFVQKSKTIDLFLSLSQSKAKDVESLPSFMNFIFVLSHEDNDITLNGIESFLSAEYIL